MFQRKFATSDIGFLSCLTPYQKCLAEAVQSEVDLDGSSYVMEVQITMLEMLEMFNKAEKVANERKRARL
jgi:hypothetical protein